MGRPGRRRDGQAVGPGHAAAGVLGHQGGHGDVRAPARAARRAGPRPAGGSLLAGVRRPGEGGHPGPLAAVAPGRAAGHRPSPAAGRPAGLGPDGGRAGRPAAGVGAGYRARVPRPDVRLAGGRGDQAGVRPQRGDVLRRGDRGAGRARLLYRAARGRTRAGQPDGHRRPAGGRGRRYPAGPDSRAVPPAGGRLHRSRFADEPGVRAQHRPTSTSTPPRRRPRRSRRATGSAPRTGWPGSTPA